MKTIICRNLHKQYKADLSFRKKLPALKDISFHVDQHEVFGIVGPNGAGKSTILKILMGFVQPDKGTAQIGTHAAGSLASHDQLGFLPENPSLYHHLTIREHLVFACNLSKLSTKDSHLNIVKTLENLDIAAAADTKIRHCSKGMVQRAALAYALILSPSILVLDEPMSGLDPLGRKLVLDIIQELKRAGTTILFCSHILTDVERVCDRIAMLDRGKLISTTSPEELERDYPEASLPHGERPLEVCFLNSIKSSRHE